MAYSLKINDLEINDGTTYAIMADSFKPAVPSLKTTYTDPALVDGQRLIADLLKRNNNDIPLSVRISASDKASLDIATGALLREIRKTDILLTLTQDGGLPTYYKCDPAAEIDAGVSWEIAYQKASMAIVSFTLPCNSGNIGDWQELDVVYGLGPYDTFTSASGSTFPGFVITGAFSATATTIGSDYLTGTCGAKATVTGTACTMTDADYIPVDENHHYNLQALMKTASADTLLTLDLRCYDSANTLLDTLHLITSADTIGTAWYDILGYLGRDIIAPTTDLSATYQWPAGTTKIKRYASAVQDTGADTLYIDSFLFTDSEYLTDYRYSAAFGINIPPEVILGDVPVPCDIYLSDAWRPAEWQSVNSGLYTNLTSVDGISATNIAAVGFYGELLQYDGTKWTPQTTGTAEHIHSLSMYDATNAWFCADNSVLGLYNPTTGVTSLTSFTYAENLTAPTFASTWVYSWDNGSLAEKTSDGMGGYYAALKVCLTSYSTSASRAYVASETLTLNRDTNPYFDIAYTYNCSHYTSGTARLDAHLYCYDSGGTLQSTKWIDSVNITGTVGATSRTVLVGNLPEHNATNNYFKLVFSLVTQDSAYYAQVNITAASVKRSASAYTLNGICALDANKQLCVGDNLSVLKRNGGSWAQVAMNPVTLGVDGTASLRAVSMISGHAWAVGDRGTILHSTDDGATWTTQTAPNSYVNFYGVLAISSTAIYAVGSQSTIIFSNDAGANWRTIESKPGLNTYTGISGSSTSVIYAVRSDGNIVAYDSTNEVFTASATVNAKLAGCYIYSATVGFAVGNSGKLFAGINTPAAFPGTALAIGQHNAYAENWNPVVKSTDGTKLISWFRNRSIYRRFPTGATTTFKFPLSGHRGRFLPSISVGLSVGAESDTCTLKGRLLTNTGTAITTYDTGQSESFSVDGNGDFSEGAFVNPKLSPITLPTHFVSENADDNKITQELQVTMPTISSGYSYLDCLTLIPVRRAFTLISAIPSGTKTVILDSSDNIAVSSLNGTIEQSAIIDASTVTDSPRFLADPYGMNMAGVVVRNTSIASSPAADGDMKLTPRVNIKLRYLPQYLLTRRAGDA